MQMHTSTGVSLGAGTLAWLLQHQPVWSLIATFVAILAGLLSTIKFFKDYFDAK